MLQHTNILSTLAGLRNSVLAGCDVCTVAGSKGQPESDPGVTKDEIEF